MTASQIIVITLIVGFVIFGVWMNKVSKQDEAERKVRMAELERKRNEEEEKRKAEYAERKRKLREGYEEYVRKNAFRDLYGGIRLLTYEEWEKHHGY